MLASPLRTPLIRTGKYGKRGAVDVGSGKVSAATHLGVDVRAAVGTPFYPVEAGVVVQTRTGWQSHSQPGTIRGSRIFTDSIGGNLVVIRGKTGDITYNHAATIAVTVGQQVGPSTQLGTTGTSGGVAPHLHVGIWPRDRTGKWFAIDPTPLLPWDGDKFEELKTLEDAMDAKQYQEFKAQLDLIESRTLKQENVMSNAWAALTELVARTRVIENAANWLKERTGGSVKGGKTVTQLLGDTSAATVDVPQLASALADELGERDSKALLDALGKRITNG